MTAKIVQVHATIDVTDIADGDPTVWLARAVDGSPFAGLYAVGDSFADARRSLAELVWLAVRHGAVDVDVTAEELAAVRVLATTHKTFAVAGFAATP